MRAQISLDLLFAVTLITLTIVNLAYIASSETSYAETFDVITNLKVFSIDVRDSVAKVYAVGDGFSIRKELPMSLNEGDKVTVTLVPSNDTIMISATIAGRKYLVIQNSPVPIYRESSVTLTEADREFQIVAKYNETEGRLYVDVSS
ncbi:hypothetical protein [Thermococcus piezophilus]|uniref:Uncharacterized protein n=1 Tax=Thermococcus piezophilus TaxID=1712654 RepID=A0A172WGY0_9EURY|nr:hypothetical protein [Thermococcus piezophilus]ANF22691.1 hypothetical protein A7C91_05520 [Thermococcus piezophilus]